MAIVDYHQQVMIFGNKAPANLQGMSFFEDDGSGSQAH
jgi:hypothetical protein